jgi:hypothetical protein
MRLDMGTVRLLTRAQEFSKNLINKPGKRIKFVLARISRALCILPTANLLCNLNFKKLALLAFRILILNKKQSPIFAKNFPLKTLIQTPLTALVLSDIVTLLRNWSIKYKKTAANKRCKA